MIIGDYGRKEHPVTCDRCGNEVLLTTSEMEIYLNHKDIGVDYWCDDCVIMDEV